MPTRLDNARDPLAQFRDGARIAGSDRAMPLVDTVIDVRILGGLAIVRTARTFTNAEARSIEATITFPVPVHATVVALTASIDGRCLVGRAQRKQAARETYESAIDAGKTAVLHEEALRGVHILSVGHIPAGKDIVVTSTWAMPIARHGSGAMLRIPVTIGDIFGRSPLPDNDDLIHAPEPQSATLTIHCDPGVAAFRDATLVNGSARVLLDRPIDLLLREWTPRLLRGIAADGRRVSLEIVPASADETPIRAALLLDQSGSMGAAASGGFPVFGGSSVASSKHQVMVDGVTRTLAALHPQDAVQLWQFDKRCEPVYSMAELWGPNGGTSIGPALTKVVRHCDAVDIAIVTDGKSHDIDVQALARSGRRFTAILVGEDSLDAYIGHLAALTGGQLFVVPGNGSAHAILTAFDTMRRPHVVQAPILGEPVAVAAQIGGMEIRARWDRDSQLAGEAAGSAMDLDELRVVGAVAAAMAIPHMEEAASANWAEAHGIVCHLTSLVMIDEAGAAQDGIPAQRKVPLMTPATERAAYPVAAAAPPPSFTQPRARAAAPVMPRAAGQGGRRIEAPAGRRSFSHALSKGLQAIVGRKDPVAPVPAAAPAPRPRDAAAGSRGEQKTAIPMALITQIDWSNAEAFRQGNTASLPPGTRAVIGWAVKFDTVEALALAVRVNPATVVIALMARVSADTDRNAARLFRAILGNAEPDLVAAATRDLGLA